MEEELRLYLSPAKLSYVFSAPGPAAARYIMWLLPELQVRATPVPVIGSPTSFADCLTGSRSLDIPLSCPSGRSVRRSALRRAHFTPSRDRPPGQFYRLVDRLSDQFAKHCVWCSAPVRRCL